MTTRKQPPWGIAPPDRIEHEWSCPRRPVVETIRHGRVALVCLTCGADDDDRGGSDDPPVAA